MQNGSIVAVIVGGQSEGIDLGKILGAARNSPIVLRQIKNPRIRNLVRGVIAAESDSVLRRTMESLRRECGPADAKVAFGFLEKTALAQSFAKPKSFPESAAGIDKIPFYEAAAFEIELASQCVRLRAEAGRMCDAIELIGRLNVAALAADSAATAECFAAYRERFGISLMVGMKAISLHHTAEATRSRRKHHADVVAPFLSPRRQITAVAFEDSVDRERAYIKMRRTYLGFLKDGRLRGGDAAVLADIFSPLSDYSYDHGQRLQAYGRWSLIDVLAHLFRLRELLTLSGRSADIEAIEQAIPDEVKAAWNASFSRSVAEQLEALVGLDDQFADLRVFSHLPAWSEYPDVLEHRIQIERAVGARLDGRFPIQPKTAASFASPSSTLDELISNGPSKPSIASRSPSSCGGFHRTIALISSVENGGVENIDGERLCRLLDETIDVAALLSRTELDALLPRRPADLLYEYLRTALLCDLEEGKVSQHALRRALQQLVASQFGGDIVQLLKHVDTEKGHLSAHLYHSCTEAFLTELYDLYEVADQVTEAQASILEWRGERRGDEDAISRARSHRLNLRLRKVRGAIEETRIYVDPLRFIQWIQEELGGELRVLATQINEISEDPERSLSLKDPVRTAVEPRLKLLKLLDRCYQEFCTNKIYGVTSYIGRRIRHGTLHGHLVLEFRPEVNRAVEEFRESAPRFSSFLQDWHRRFESAVLQMAADAIHVRSKEKPKGVIVASLDETEKSVVSALMLAEVISALKESSQLVTSMARIREYCWHLFEIDLQRARRAVEELRREFVISVDQHTYTERPDLDRRISERIRALNSTMQQRFEVVKSWFTRPTNLSPSASVKLLFEAVLDEVRQRYPDFQPVLSMDVSEELDLIGHRFHFFYDALYILVDNAAKHGKRNGPLNVTVVVDGDKDYFHLTVAIGSDFDEAAVIESRAAIDEALCGEIGDAMVNHGRSGIRKLRGLVESVEEIVGFSREYVDRSVVFTIEMRYLRS